MLLKRLVGWRWKRDNQFIPSKRAKELKAQGVDVKEVETWQACYFPDYQFRELFKKHVQKISRDPKMTVLVKGEAIEPTEDEFLDLIVNTCYQGEMGSCARAAGYCTCAKGLPRSTMGTGKRMDSTRHGAWQI